MHIPGRGGIHYVDIWQGGYIGQRCGRVRDLHDNTCFHQYVSQAARSSSLLLFFSPIRNFLAEAKSLSPKGFKTVMDIDAQGTYNMSHSVYPAMSKGGNGGAIINISMTLHYGGELLQFSFICFVCALKSCPPLYLLVFKKYSHIVFLAK